MKTHIFITYITNIYRCKFFIVSAILALYFPVALGGFLVYGDEVAPNIVLSLSRGPLVMIANVCMALHLILAFLIVVNPICQEIENLLDVPRGKVKPLF